MFMGIAAGIVGSVMVCLLVFIQVHDKPNFTIRGMIGTLAISLIGGQVLLQNFGPKAKLLPEFFGYGKVKILDITITADKIVIICSSIIMLIIVVRWMKSSRRGLEIRAMMMNPHAASIVGIGVRKTGIYVMAVTGAMTGLAAVLLSQTYYLSPFSGLTPMIKGVSIALMGGLGSVRGAVIAAIILGFNEALTSKFLGGRYVLMTQFLLIIIVLIIRPRGIAGILDKAREALVISNKRKIRLGKIHWLFGGLKVVIMKFLLQNIKILIKFGEIQKLLKFQLQKLGDFIMNTNQVIMVKKYGID